MPLLAQCSRRGSRYLAEARFVAVALRVARAVVTRRGPPGRCFAAAKIEREINLVHASLTRGSTQKYNKSTTALMATNNSAISIR